MAVIHVTDASGRRWQHRLSPGDVCPIGRTPDGNAIVLADRHASRHHAHIAFRDGAFVLVDGVAAGGEVRRSANGVLVNGQAGLEHRLRDGDLITIGESTLRFEDVPAAPPYDDDPLGRTQVIASPGAVIASAVARGRAAREAGEARPPGGRGPDVLSLVYELSSALSSAFDLDAVFDKVTDVLLRVTPADRVLALLTAGDGAGAAGASEGLRVVAMKVRRPDLEARASRTGIGRTITRKVIRERQALLSQDASADPTLAGTESIISQGIRSTICAPLIAGGTVSGALYADRLDAFAWFTEADLHLATAVAAQAAVALESLRARERLAREETARASYGRFVPEYVARQIHEDPASVKLGGVSRTVTVLFADIRGFTRLSERAAPEDVVQVLNRYFASMSEIIVKHRGTLDKFIGDGLMALFGSAAPAPDDARNAVEAAVEMQHEIETINGDLRGRGLPEIHIGVGIHTGVALVGYIGSERRSEFTAIGDAVNVAARLESNSKPGQILVSADTRDAAADSAYRLVPREPITVKNREQPVEICEVEWRAAPPG